ncbi:hypothetical protein D9M71_419380 [compost metagenome]
MARSKAAKDQRPIPVSGSGVILVLYNVPKGVSIASPPALTLPPPTVWHTAQSPAAATWRPRSSMAALQLPTPGGVTGAISARQGKAVASMPNAAPNTPASEPNHHFERLVDGCAGAGASGPWPSPPSAARTRSAVIGSSRKRMPVASKMALAMAAALGTEADSPLPIGGSCWRGSIITSIAGTSGKVRIG